MLPTGTTTTEAAAPPRSPVARRAGYGGRTSSLKGRSRDRYRDGLRPPLTPETSTAPNRRTARAGPAPAPLARDAQNRTNHKITITESLRFHSKITQATRSKVTR
jgi:hypothetical protein